MDGKIEWQALPFFIELYDVHNIEILVAELDAVRGHMRKVAEHG